MNVTGTEFKSRELILFEDKMYRSYLNSEIEFNIAFNEFIDNISKDQLLEYMHYLGTVYCKSTQISFYRILIEMLLEKFKDNNDVIKVYKLGLMKSKLEG